MKSREQLERLLKNPHYVMSIEDQRLLEQYRAQEWEQDKKRTIRKSKNQPVKHDVTVHKHPTDVPEEIL